MEEIEVQPFGVELAVDVPSRGGEGETNYGTECAGPGGLMSKDDY